MVCEEDIGWRDQSRKVIIYTTDQSFHIAMDGKLGGIVTPNDGKCHLNPSGYYSYSKIQDYPSIGHINHIAKNKSVNIIWAVTEDKIGLYRTLSNHVFGSSSGTLSFDSSNIGMQYSVLKSSKKFKKIREITIHQKNLQKKCII